MSELGRTGRILATNLLRRLMPVIRYPVGDLARLADPRRGHLRKNAVIDLEESMAWHGGQRIVGRQTGTAENGRLKSSPTGLIMVMLPLLVAVCWVAMAGVIIAM
ncbi:hypothetical protein [Streptomyces sp. NPDC053079]|uniref:hypothetical protein n=1 Tax=Streptomyces sp. NPDC053079 TaxID=3365697 RepID=UPI0037D01A4A